MTIPLRPRREDARALARFLDVLAKEDEGHKPDWSLRLLVRAFRATGVYNAPAGMLAEVLADSQNQVRSLLSAIAILDGYEPSMLGATAKAALSLVPPVAGKVENRYDYLWSTFLLIGDEMEEVESTAILAEEKAAEAVNLLLDVAFDSLQMQREVSAMAVNALQSAWPVLRVQAKPILIKRILAASDGDSGVLLMLLAALACEFDTESVNSLGADCDPFIRASVAAIVAHLAVCDGDQDLRELFMTLARDVDGLVRAEMYEHLLDPVEGDIDPIPVWALEELKAAQLIPISGWSCLGCGRRGQDVDQTECPDCSSPRPKFRLLFIETGEDN
ncbi:UNVERIFIED_ORG: hypothetical protein FHR35_004900 [Microbispora rosea subsp. rosea]